MTQHNDTQNSLSRPTLTETTCPYCGVGCGIDASRIDDSVGEKGMSVEGTRSHPANAGRLCVKGQHLPDTTDLQGRLLNPQINGVDVDWTDAAQAVADAFSDSIREYGPESVAFYVSGQLLTEDYYVANKLMKGFIGSANIDSNSRLCMSSAVSAYLQAFGEDVVPCCYDDLEQTDTIFLVGSNAAWTHPVLFQRIERYRKINPELRVVVIDPRRTATASAADVHVAIKPGTDVAFYNGLLHFLRENAFIDSDFITAHTEHFEHCADAVAPFCSADVARICDVEEQDVLRAYHIFARSPRVLSLYSMGVNQSTSGVDKALSIINCHLASAKIGKAGCGPFSLTGQPNAMGGREVGGLASLLAAHLSFDNPEHGSMLQAFWQSPTLAHKPGLKAVDLFARMREGQIKTVWIMGTNPVVSLPDRNQVIEALKACDTVIVSDCMANTDTIQFADIRLPSTTWSEKNGTVTNSERRISRQRSFMPAPGHAKDDWRIICDVAARMGHGNAFAYSHPSQIFAEHARLSGINNEGQRAFDISGLSSLSQHDYDNLRPIQWPVNRQYPSGKARILDDNRFFTESGKAQFKPTVYTPPVQQTSESYPFILNSGRTRDQWHTMTRTGKSSVLNQHQAYARLSVHPGDAKRLGLCELDLVNINAGQAHAQQLVVPIAITNDVRLGELFLPIHWNGQNASASSVAVAYQAAVDPVSGQPELKHGAVALQKLQVQYTGIVVSNTELSREWLNNAFVYWSESPVEGGYAYRVASQFSIAELSPCFDRVGASASVSKASSNQFIYISEDEQKICLLARLVGQAPSAVDVAQDDAVNSPWQGHLEWYQHLLIQPQLTLSQRDALMADEIEASFLRGDVVCSCFTVHQQDIIDAIHAGCNDVQSLGHTLKCGTNCGSCKTELARLVEAEASTAPIEASIAEPAPLSDIPDKMFRQQNTTHAKDKSSAHARIDIVEVTS